MSARTKARKRALDLLFAAELREQPIAEIVAAEGERAANEPDRQASWQYARDLALGVDAHADEIDETIQTYARGWTLQRMPLVDRAILRIGTWELLHNPAVPPAVTVSEAVKLAGEFSTDDSAGFVNGVLGRIAETVPASSEPAAHLDEHLDEH